VFILNRVDEAKLPRVRPKIFPDSDSGDVHPESVNTKLARNAIGRSTPRLKGNSCNGGNSENYINARNRKVYTMIELHGVGLLAEGQSASHWRYEFFLLVTRVRRLIYIYIFFF